MVQFFLLLHTTYFLELIIKYIKYKIKLHCTKKYIKLQNINYFVPRVGIGVWGKQEQTAIKKAFKPRLSLVSTLSLPISASASASRLGLDGVV